MKKNCLIIFGSPSPEYFVNCQMAADIIRNIDKNKYDVIKLGINREGMWFVTDATPDQIENGEDWLTLDNKTAVISPEKNSLLFIIDRDKIEKVHIDVAFGPIAGEYGEDGKLPALLDMANIPYVGSDSAASACSLDKCITRIFADNIGLKQPNCVMFSKKEYTDNKKSIIDKINELKYPLFVKPPLTGSSIGISKVIDAKSLEKAIDEAFKFGNSIIIEEGLTNFSEIKVAMYGNGDSLECGSIMRLTAASEGDSFNDYQTKYSSNATPSKKEMPIITTDEIKKQIETDAKNIFNALGCRDYARVDMFLTDDNVLYFNEINTNPGFTSHSIHPKMMMDKGYKYSEIINGLLDMAINRTK